MGSDHRPIHVALSLRADLINVFSHRTKIPEKHMKYLYGSFNERADMILSGVADISDQGPIAQYEFFIKSILDVARSLTVPSPRGNRVRDVSQSHPQSSSAAPSGTRVGCARSPAPPWWSDECSEAIARRKRAARDLRRNPSRLNFEMLLDECRRCRGILRSAKRGGWRTFCESLGPFTPTGKVWKQICRFKNRKLAVTFESSLPHGNRIDCDPQITQVMNRICTSSCSPNIDIDPSAEVAATTSWLAGPFELEELLSALRMAKLKSSPGMDAVEYRMIKELPSSLLELLLEIINRLFSSASFPQSWRHSLVFLIPKPGDKGYRPIALTSCVLKLVERMLLFRIQWYMESECKLPDFQFGFRRARSCLDNLAILSSEIFKGYFQKKVTAALFIDVESAFDNVQPNMLIQELQRLNFPAKVLQFVNNLIAVREVQFVIHGQLTDARLSRKGTPQGSVLSPMLFNIYLNRIRSSIPVQVNILQFADDIVLYFAAHDQMAASRVLQRALYSLDQYLAELGLEISPSKTQYVLFSRRAVTQVVPHLEYLEHSICPVDEVRFLGVLLDSRMTGVGHMNSLISRGKRINQAISALRGTWWGSHPQVFLKIYQSMLRGSVEYASLIFAIRDNTLFSRLEKVQNASIRLCLGARISTPVSILYAEACEPPFIYRFRYLANKFITNVLSRSGHPLAAKLDELAFLARGNQIKGINLRTNFPLLGCYELLRVRRAAIHSSRLPLEFMIPYRVMHVKPSVYFADKRFTATIEGQNFDFIQGYFKHYFREITEGAVVIYTDGSKSSNANFVGSACFSDSPRIELMFQLPKSASVFTAETWAIYNALLAAFDLNLNKVLIVSDSRSALEALQDFSAKQNNYLISRIRAKIEYIMSTRLDFDLRFLWIPSHRGIAGNERADALAKRAITEGSSPRNFKLPHSDILAELRERMTSRFERYLDLSIRLGKGVQYHRLIRCKMKKPWFARYSMSRSHITPTIRLRSNHYNLNASLHRKNLINNPSCSCGGPQQDFNHVLFDCPLTFNKGYALREIIYKALGPNVHDITKALAKPSQKFCRILAAYCKACGFNI